MPTIAAPLNISESSLRVFAYSKHSEIPLRVRTPG
jgi:hypothetical protein